ncbi:MAG: hypothetical protein JNL59_10255 [Chitinophagaceae bacterium]|nr:hypothetical protein [Chitinophagaceae bacterium]
MKKKIQFTDFRDLCIANSGSKYVSQILDIIYNGDCIFHPGIIMPRTQMSSLYRLRLEIQKDHESAGNEFLNDYENTVVSMETSQSKEIGICSLITDQESYLVFSEPEEGKIAGIIKTQYSGSIANCETDIDKSIRRGYTSDTEKYTSGILVREWQHL